MRTMLLAGVSALALAWSGAALAQATGTAPAAQGAAQGGQAAAEATSGTSVTGIVTSADDQTREIVIDGETFVMPEQGGGAALMPNEGDEVTLFYREEGGQKLITRIGQKQQ